MMASIPLLPVAAFNLVPGVGALRPKRTEVLYGIATSAWSKRFRPLDAEKNARPAQLAIAWAPAKGERIVPLLGARTRAQLDESLGALRIELAAPDVARIEYAIRPSEVAGTRYDAHQISVLDSER